MELSLDIIADDWHQLAEPHELVEAAVGAAFEVAKYTNKDAELSVVLASDEFVADLNQRWRGKSGPTNVLSFPVGDQMAHGDDEPEFLGDIVLASGVVFRQARESGKPLATHLSHLVVHGVLHLLGYDHQDDESAEKMQAIETAAMVQLDLPDPYLEHDVPVAAG